MARHLFDCWNEVTKRVAAAGAVRIFLDFDGTLAPLCDAPEEITLSTGTRRALETLVRRPQVTAAIISGRRRENLIRHVRLRGLQYWGLFGWERRGRYVLPRPERLLVSHARARLTSRLHGLPGVRIEDKGVGFSVHIRGATGNTGRKVRGRLERAMARYRPALHILTGRDVWNVLPSRVPGKGRAVRDALQGVRAPFLPIYVGDDATDEPAFAALSRGITVRVGAAQRTKARYRLSDPDEVRRFIERLEDELS